MTPDAEYDAGETGCGELLMELHLRMRRLPPSQTLRVTARDPAAPVELPAWCRLTGHQLLEANPPVYLIRKES